MKKTILAMAMAAALVLGMTACQPKTGDQQAAASADQPAKKVKVVATMFPEYDFARQVGGDLADVTMLLKPGAESHTFEPTPQDITSIQNCDLFLYTGGDSDTWIKGVLSTMDTSKMKVMRLIDMVPTVDEEQKEGMMPDDDDDQGNTGVTGSAVDASDHSTGSAAANADQSNDKNKVSAPNPDLDEHVWTSPKNAIQIVNKIRDTYDQIDPANKATYDSNAAAYTAKLTDLDNQFRTVVDQGKRKTVVFGDRFPLRYFVDEFGLDYWAAFPGCSADTEASAATVAFLTDKVKEEKIPVVFQIELSTGNVANTIAEATGAKVLTFNTCHNVTKKDFDAGATYYSQMEQNVDALKEALN